MADADITLLARSNGLDHARLGLAIARKQLPRAVARNRIKRLARESFRQHQRELAGMDVIVMVRRGIGERSNSEIFTQLEALWRKLRKKLAPQPEQKLAKPCNE